ncbi:hypothetical protein [Thermosyntropha lipolytica]|uniref:hypothetical protein n=1 Tax=Thermosyntropha lipolytica TaxID=54294 RepID=UPI00190EBE50
MGKKQGINYKTAWKWYKEGKLPVPAYQTPTGTILVKVGEEKEGGQKVSQKPGKKSHGGYRECW